VAVALLIIANTINIGADIGAMGAAVELLVGGPAHLYCVTTISPYLLFWQSEEEVEQMKSESKEKPLKKAPRQAPEELKRIKIDTYIGMGFSTRVLLSMDHLIYCRNVEGKSESGMIRNAGFAFGMGVLDVLDLGHERWRNQSMIYSIADVLAPGLDPGPLAKRRVTRSPNIGPSASDKSAKLLD
jgi:hypothetical protein